jgi:processive 1,2-diacylglycerol beta-glucosyltransferase
LAFQELLPEAKVELRDTLLEQSPHLGKVLQKGYLFSITRMPRVWYRIYQMMEKSGGFARRTRLFASMTRFLEKILDDMKPRFVASTYPLYATLFERMRAEGKRLPPLFTVVTDSISINRMWTNEPSSHWLVADDDTKGIVQEMTGAPGRVHTTGFPVHPSFAGIAASSGPPAVPRRLLFFCHRKTEDVAAELAALSPLLDGSIHLTLLMGRNQERLYHVVTRFCDAHPDAHIRVIGWSNQVPQLMAESHAVISKAGGATTHEALAARCPMIIDSVVPGQEEGNAELLVRNGCGIIARTPSELSAAVSRLLAPSLTEWRKFRDNMIRVGHPDAARNAARLMLELSPPGVPWS